MKFFLCSFLLLVIFSCSSIFYGPYDKGLYLNSPKLKKVIIPLQPGTNYKVRQGAFGKSSHDKKGNQFQWDLQVPLGTTILSVDDGIVMYLYQPENPKGGCNPNYAKY
jgi:hypothetical protein